jgi:hypothetical protein
MTPELIGKAQRMYDARQFTIAEVAASCAVTATSTPANPRPEPRPGEQRTIRSVRQDHR